MILSDSGSERVLHPEGQFVGVCVDVVDVGIAETAYGPKLKVRFVFETDAQIEKKDAKGNVLGMFPMIIGRRFTATLNEKGHLRPFLDSWVGRKLTETECRRFDAERMIGVAALLTIDHNTGQDGKEYDNILSIAKLPKQMESPEASGHYVRVQNRPTDPNAPRKASDARPQPPTPQPRRPESQTRDLQAAGRKAAAAADDPYADFPTALVDDDDDLPF